MMNHNKIQIAIALTGGLSIGRNLATSAAFESYLVNPAKEKPFYQQLNEKSAKKRLYKRK